MDVLFFDNNYYLFACYVTKYSCDCAFLFFLFWWLNVISNGFPYIIQIWWQEVRAHTSKLCRRSWLDWFDLIIDIYFMMSTTMKKSARWTVSTWSIWLNKETGTVLPQNIVNGRFVHFSADNIDILDQTLNEKDTFHATQMTAWQRGPEKKPTFELRHPSPNVFWMYLNAWEYSIHPMLE